MKKQDFDSIADIIRRVYVDTTTKGFTTVGGSPLTPDVVVEQIAYDLATKFNREHDGFDRGKFLIACGVVGV
jgi:hypothetical protein